MFLLAKLSVAFIFNGNNYSEEWVHEAEKRGLLNVKTSVDAFPLFIKENNVELITEEHMKIINDKRAKEKAKK